MDDSFTGFPNGGEGHPDEAAALLYAAEHGAIKSIRAWQRRGGDINAPVTSPHDQVRTPAYIAPQGAVAHSSLRVWTI